MTYDIVSSPWVKKAVPIALTSVAGIGVVGTAVLAAKATPKALERKAKAEEEKGEELTTFESLKAMLPSYIPAISTGTATLASIAGLAIVNHRQQMELATIVAGGNQMLNQISKKYNALRDDVKEKDPDILRDFDQKTLDDEWEDYVKERMKKKAHCWPECLQLNSSEEYGETRMFCIEYGLGLADENGHEMLFFEATPGDIIAAFYNINGLFREEGFMRLNTLFAFLGLPKTDLGHKLVWDISVLYDMYERDFIDFDTEDIPLEGDDVPEPAICTRIILKMQPLADGYGEYEDVQSALLPSE